MPLTKTDQLKWIKKIWLEKEIDFSNSKEKIEILIWFPQDFYRVTGLSTDSDIETKELECKGKALKHVISDKKNIRQMTNFT